MIQICHKIQWKKVQSRHIPNRQQDVPGLESEMEPKPDYGESSYRGCGKLKGKSALITGGDSGIGRAVALAFAREGADILISYLNEESDAQETVRIVQKEGRKCIAVAGDIDEESHASISSICCFRIWQDLHNTSKMSLFR